MLQKYLQLNASSISWGHASSMHLPLSLHIVQQPYHIFSSCSITIPNMIHHQQLPSNYCNLLHPSRPFCRSSFALCGLFAQEPPNQRPRALQPPSSPNGGTVGQHIGRQARAELSSEIQRDNSSGLMYKFATDYYPHPQGSSRTRYQIDYNRDWVTRSYTYTYRVRSLIHSEIELVRRRDYPCLAIEAETI